VLWLVVTAGCGSPPDLVGEVETGAVELLDTTTLARLGVPEPAIDWERSIDRLRYVGAGRAPSDAEVGLVRQVIDDMPTSLLASTEVRWVVRSSEVTGARPNHPTAVAFAVGPDIYLLDRAFGLSEGGSTRFDLARAVAHELVHVAQFGSLETGYVEAALDGQLAQLDPIAGSALAAAFAEETGWALTSTDPLARTWALNAGVTAASAYGATSPGEDMAEAVALVVLGLADLVPPDRVRWVEGWLGAPADALAIGQPWVPAGSTEVLSADPLYDTEAVAAVRGALTHEEPLYFELARDVEPSEELAETIESRLRSRVLAGSMDRIPDDRVPRFGGRFNRPDGTMWWVELWDFRERAVGVTGPSTPILVYVALW